MFEPYVWYDDDRWSKSVVKIQSLFIITLYVPLLVVFVLNNYVCVGRLPYVRDVKRAQSHLVASNLTMVLKLPDYYKIITKCNCCLILIALLISTT